MKMKCAVVVTLISLAFVSQTFAVLRPLFPIKPVAPSNGEFIVVGDELVLRAAKKPMLHHRGQAQYPVPGPPAMAFVMRAVPCTGCALEQISTHARRGIKKDCFSPPAFVSLSTHAKLWRDTRYALLSQSRHVIGTRERKARSRRDLERFGVASFIST